MLPNTMHWKKALVRNDFQFSIISCFGSKIDQDEIRIKGDSLEFRIGREENWARGVT